MIDAARKPSELIVLSVLDRMARCREPGTGRRVLLRASGLWNVVPGEIVRIAPRKEWHYGERDDLSGTIEGSRVDVDLLGLEPLRLEPRGTWDPDDESWGEEDEPLEEWARALVERGPTPQFEMEQVLPGDDPGDPDGDPILAALERRSAGDPAGARRMLMEMLDADLRCLDAHAHLGLLAFDDDPHLALRYYTLGVRIGERALGPGFDGVVPWTLIDNRPFLRCLHGFGLCRWRLGATAEAAAAFERLLRLNPSDAQGARFLLEPVHAGEPWEPWA